MIRLGKVTQASPLLVKLNGDTGAAAAEPAAGMVLAVDQEVLVVLAESRRLVIWAK